MSTELSLCDAARRSNLGLSGLMQAIRSGKLASSRGSQGAFVVREGDLNRFLESQERGQHTVHVNPAHSVPLDNNDDAKTREAINRVRTAFGATQSGPQPRPESQPQPQPQPQPAKPIVSPARDLGQWCDNYLSDLRKAEWFLRKLEADAEWLNTQLQRDEPSQVTAEERPASS